MIRFDFFRKKSASFALAALVATGMMTSIPQHSFANDWTDMLKPLVKDVLVPSATKGMKKLLQLEEQRHPALTQAVTGTAPVAAYTTTATVATPTATSADSSGTAQFFSSSTSSSDSLSSPEEPMSTASSGAPAASASTLTASSSTSTSDSAAPAPPPPVATP